MALATLKREIGSQRVGDAESAMRLVPSNLGDVFRQADLADDLATIERLLIQRTASSSRLLAAAGAHTVAAGGKRLRAALVLLAARLGDYQFVRAARPAVAIELLHAASLVHDDLVDHTLRRRGRVTVHSRWDSHVALMLGDYFFAVSANELAAEQDPRIIRFYADAARTVVEGELRPVTQLEPLEVALAQYRYKIGSKTAALFEAACKAGIAVAGGTSEQIEALGQFGYDLGLAFQIVDDVLDFTGDETLLGKPAGNDLREGTLTLPLIYAVAQGGSPLLREVAHSARPDPVNVPQLVAAVIAAGGTDLAMHEAHQTVERALGHLSTFPPSSAMRALSDICDFVLNRQV
jgi:heptaprenyl diphosphate synthase/octaprenyl-diphosphate synthase